MISNVEFSRGFLTGEKVCEGSPSYAISCAHHAPFEKVTLGGCSFNLKEGTEN